MTWTLLVTPRAGSVVKCLAHFTKVRAEFAKDFKRMVSRSSFEDVVVPEILRINDVLAEHDSTLFFVQPRFARDPITGRVNTLLELHPRVRLKQVKVGFEISIDS